VTRWLLAVGGLVVMGAGVRLLVVETNPETPGQVAAWLAGAVVVHDLLLAPLVLAVGLALRSLPFRGPARGGLLVAGCLTLVALPPLLRPGTPRNPTVLPLDYGRHLTLLLAVVAAGAVAVALVSRLGRGPHPDDDQAMTGPS
jgi:hypothetical protein